MGKIKGTILETILTGLTALALVFLAVIFAGMTRQSLVFLLLFLLVAVLAGLVGYLLWKAVFLVRKVFCLEEELDELQKRVEKLERPRKTEKADG